METIVEKFILQLEAQLAERKVAFSLDPEARTWLARKGFDPVYGARPLARVIQQEVRNPLTDEILFGQLENGGHVRIGLADDHLTHLRFRLRCAAVARAEARAYVRSRSIPLPELKLGPRTSRIDRRPKL